MLRDFILGNNQTGLVTNTSSGTVTVVGGENQTLAGTVHPGQLGIFVGSGTTQSTYTFPSATVAAWNTFLFAETANATVTASATGTGGPTQSPSTTQSGAWRAEYSVSVLVSCALLAVMQVL